MPFLRIFLIELGTYSNLTWTRKTRGTHLILVLCTKITYRVTKNAQLIEKTIFSKVTLTKDLNQPRESSVTNEELDNLCFSDKYPR